MPCALSHTPFPWLRHRLTGSGHEARRRGLSTRAQTARYTNESDDWLATWEYEVHARRMLAEQSDWSLGAVAAIQTQRGQHRSRRADVTYLPPNVFNLDSTYSIRWRHPSFERQRIRAGVELAWRDRARVAAGLMHEDGAGAAEPLTFDGRRERRVLPSISADARWAWVRLHVGWGRSRVGQPALDFLIDAFEAGFNPRPVAGERSMSEAGVTADLAGGRIRVGATGSRTRVRSRHVYYGLYSYGTANVLGRIEALETRLEATVLQSTRVAWDAAVALMFVWSRVLDTSNPLLQLWALQPQWLQTGAWPGIYRGVRVQSVDTIAGTALVGGSREDMGHAAADLEGLVRSGWSAGPLRLDAAVQIRRGNTVFNSAGYQRDFYTATRLANDPQLSAADRIRRMGPFVDSIGGSIFPPITSGYLEDGSFVRLRDVALTLTLPRNVARISLPAGELTLAGRDLLTFSGYSGPDPEVNMFSPSHPRTIVSRLTVRF